MLCSECWPDSKEYNQDEEKKEGEVDILDHDAGVDEWYYKPSEPYKDEEYEE